MFLPRPLTVAGISRATRAGFATEKLAGTPWGAFFSSMLTTTPLLVWMASTRSIAFPASLDAACAQTNDADAIKPSVAATRDKHTATFWTLILIACSLVAQLVFGRLLAIPTSWAFRSIRQRRPERFPSNPLRFQKSS